MSADSVRRHARAGIHEGRIFVSSRPSQLRCNLPGDVSLLQRILTRMELEFRAVQADTGNIGGDNSHEFHVLAESGEDTIAYSDTGTYAANLEKAAALYLSRLHWVQNYKPGRYA